MFVVRQLILNIKWVVFFDAHDKQSGEVSISFTKNDIESVRRRGLKSNCKIVVCEISPSKGRKITLSTFYRSPSSTIEYFNNKEDFKIV